MNWAADPWGVALGAAAGVCGLAVLWWLVALAMKQPARGAGTLLALGLLAYLGIAVGATAVRVLTPPPPAPPAPSGPPKVISAPVPEDRDDAKKKPGADAKTLTPAKGAGDEPKREPAADAKAEASGDDAKGGAGAGGGDSVGGGPADAPAKVAAEGPIERVELGPPTLAGREALRFIDGVSGDEARCRDADAIAKAAREVPAMVPEVSAVRAKKAAEKLEACRRKLVWTRAYTVRTERVAARLRFADELPARMKTDHGLAVLVTMRGAASERIRIGGGGLDEARAKQLLDGGLRDELVALGFSEVVLANMKASYKEALAVPTDNQLAERQLAPQGLDRKIAPP